MKRTLYKNVLNCGGAFNCVFANGTNRSTHERVKKNIHKLLFLCFFFVLLQYYSTRLYDFHYYGNYLAFVVHLCFVHILISLDLIEAESICGLLLLLLLEQIQ